MTEKEWMEEVEVCQGKFFRGRSFDTLKRWQNILVRIILSRAGRLKELRGKMKSDISRPDPILFFKFAKFVWKYLIFVHSSLLTFELNGGGIPSAEVIC